MAYEAHCVFTPDLGDFVFLGNNAITSLTASLYINEELFYSTSKEHGGSTKLEVFEKVTTLLEKTISLSFE